jgi:hypothetical protein
VSGNRADALARLGVFVGEWVMEARFPGDQPGPSGAEGQPFTRLMTVSANAFSAPILSPSGWVSGPVP